GWPPTAKPPAGVTKPSTRAAKPPARVTTRGQAFCRGIQPQGAVAHNQGCRQQTQPPAARASYRQ
ncbi:hypothetical protein B296_00049602, partial [Ensete ventricosum]